MKSKISLLQIICLCVILLSLLGLGWEVFLDDLNHMAALYILAGLACAGFVLNTALALYRIFLEMKK